MSSGWIEKKVREEQILARSREARSDASRKLKKILGFNLSLDFSLRQTYPVNYTI
jgi:hypothetical protein